MFLFDFSWPIQHFLNQFWWQINFLLLAILVALGYLSWKKPAYAAGLTIILLPTYLFRAKIWFLPFTYLEVCIWITFIGWLIQEIKKSKNQKIKKLIISLILPTYRPTDLPTYLWPIILIITGATVSTFLGPNLAAAAGIWKAYFIEPLMFFLVLTSILKTEEGKKTILWSLGISTLSISLLAIFQKFTGFGIPQPDWLNAAARRVTAMFTSPNAVGLYLAPIVLIYLGWLLENVKNFKLSIDQRSAVSGKRLTNNGQRSAVSGKQLAIFGWQLLIIALSALAILFTKSAGTFLGLGAGLIFLAIFGWNKKITAGISLAAIAIALILPIGRAEISSLMFAKDASGQNRLTLIQISRDYLLTSPKNFIFGAGLGGFAQIQNENRDPLKLEPLLYPHNIILNFWLETGLLGLIGFIWLIILFFKNGFKKTPVGAYSNTPLRIGLMAAMIAVIIHGLIDVPYFKNDLAILFWVIIGLL